MSLAKQRLDEAESDGANYVSTWWAGYHRGLEDVLNMEHE